MCIKTGRERCVQPISPRLQRVGWDNDNLGAIISWIIVDFVLKMMDFILQNDGFHTENDGICTKMLYFVLKTMDDCRERSPQGLSFCTRLAWCTATSSPGIFCSRRITRCDFRAFWGRFPIVFRPFPGRFWSFWSDFTADYYVFGVISRLIIMFRWKSRTWACPRSWRRRRQALPSQQTRLQVTIL